MANRVVLACLMGKKRAEVEGLLVSLKGADEQHRLVRDLAEKDRLFEEARGRYTAKVAVAS